MSSSDCPKAWITSSCVVTCPSQWYLHFGEEIIVARTHMGWVWWMFQYLPSPAVKEVLDSISSMSPSSVLKDEGVHWQQVLSFSPECWMSVIIFIQHSGESNGTCCQWTPSSFMTMQRLILLMLSRTSFTTGISARYESVWLWFLR
jgi:hypothetical protein